MAAAAVDLKNQLMQEEIEMAAGDHVAESNGSASQSSAKGMIGNQFEMS